MRNCLTVSIPTSNEWEFLLLHILVSFWCCQCFIFQPFYLAYSGGLLLFWFAFPKWHIMLCIFSYVYLPSVYRLWWGICSGLLLILKFRAFIFLLLGFKNSSYVLDNNPTCLLQIFSPSLCLAFSFSWHHFLQSRSF